MEEVAVLPGDRAAAVHAEVALRVEVKVPGVHIVSIVVCEELCSAPSVPQSVFTITEKAPTQLLTDHQQC